MNWQDIIRTVNWKDLLMIVEFLLAVGMAVWGYSEKLRSRPIRSMLIGIYNMAHGFTELYASEHGAFSKDGRNEVPMPEVLHFANSVCGTWMAFEKSILGAIRAIDEKGEIWKEVRP